MAGKGVNVWFELMTTDLEGATRFYSETIGWKPQPMKGADPAMPYTMWMVGEAMAGGMMALPEEAAAMGAPPHWMAYTTVDEVDATAALTEKLGGKVLKPAFDIPNIGRIAILADPQGAAFAVFKPEGEMEAPDREASGRFSWAELNTSDYEAAWAFYSELFGWAERGKMEMEQGGTYFMFQDPSEATVGGMSNMAKKMGVPAHWLHYVTVDDVEATVARIEKQGGKVLNGPMQIPGDDVIAQCQDAQGAAFAIYAKGKK